MTLTVHSRRLLITALSTSLLAACNLHLSMNAEAKDQWQRHYSLAKGGSLEIRNSNGVIYLEPTDGDSVEVTADRIVKAVTDQAAKDGLAGFEIQETVKPDRIVLDGSSRGTSFGMDMSRRVDFHVKAPAWANLKLETTNGDISVTGGRLTGKFHAETTNGQVKATGLENNAAASTTNGGLTLELSKLGEDGVSCETTNGAISLTVPPDINARLSARVTNGAISPKGLNLNVSEQSKRRLDATIGSGGPTIKLETTNGSIQIRSSR